MFRDEGRKVTSRETDGLDNEVTRVCTEPCGQTLRVRHMLISRIRHDRATHMVKVLNNHIPMEIHLKFSTASLETFGPSLYSVYTSVTSLTFEPVTDRLVDPSKWCLLGLILLRITSTPFSRWRLVGLIPLRITSYPGWGTLFWPSRYPYTEIEPSCCSYYEITYLRRRTRHGSFRYLHLEGPRNPWFGEADTKVSYFETDLLITRHRNSKL